MRLQLHLTEYIVICFLQCLCNVIQYFPWSHILLVFLLENGILVSLLDMTNTVCYCCLIIRMFFNHRPKYVDLSPSSTVQCNCSQLHRRSQNVESLHAMMTHEMLTPHAVDSTAKNVDTTHYRCTKR